MPEKPSSKGLIARITMLLCIAISLFHLYTGGFGLLSAMDQRGIHLLFMLLISLLLKPGGKKYMVWDVLVIAGALSSGLFALLSWRGRSGAYIPTTIDVVFGLIMIIVILEATRRQVGLALALTAVLFLAYGLWGHNLPGMLAHKPYSLKRLVTFLYTTTEGIFGLPISISATFVMLFVLFGAFLNASGGGKLFIDIAFAVTGRARGGPAKAAVFSSALMGSISGSSIANVVTTGTFTIPLMIKTGYPPYVAAAIEAVASTGGMIMPPVMGAAAFLMAEYLNMTYLEVVKAAVLPAILYYIAVYFFVDFEAIKRNLTGRSREDGAPSLMQCIIKGWYSFVPLVTLVVWIIQGWSAMRAAFWSIVVLLATMAVSSIIQRVKIRPSAIVEALIDGGKSSVSVAVACACAGIILGVLGVTGLGVKLSTFILALSGGSLFLGLILSALTSLILGTGLPATAIYVMMAAINAPALIQMGADPIAVHLFLFYFGIISTLTPPVALTAYAAAAIAGSEPNRTGVVAFQYGILAYIIPFMFVYQSELLMQGGMGEIVHTFITGTIGVYFIGGGIQGYFRIHPANILERVGFACGGLLLLDPGLVTDLGGGVIVIISLASLYLRRRKALAGSAKPGEMNGNP